MSSIKLYKDVDVAEDQSIKFFNLDQRLLNALKEDDIEKYLLIVREKQMEEYKLKERKIDEIEQKKKEEYIQSLVKKEEELFEENKIEIHKRIQEKIQQRMISDIKSMMIYNINDSILKLENKIREKMPVIKPHNPLSDTYFTIFVFLIMEKYYK